MVGKGAATPQGDDFLPWLHLRALRGPRRQQGTGFSLDGPRSKLCLVCPVSFSGGKRFLVQRRKEHLGRASACALGAQKSPQPCPQCEVVPAWRKGHLSLICTKGPLGLYKGDMADRWNRKGATRRPPGLKEKATAPS